jgi:GNAT superfamily N-acetyltransferase
MDDPAVAPRDVTIRFAVAADVPQIIELVRETLGEFGLRFGEGSKTDEELARLPGSYEDAGGAFWVATDGAGRSVRLLGTCGVAPVAPGTFELRKMYLHGEARGLRLGKRLLQGCVDWVRTHGGRRIVLDTTEQMTRAIRFYEGNGFVRDDAQVRGARCSRGYVREL